MWQVPMCYKNRFLLRKHLQIILFYPIRQTNLSTSLNKCLGNLKFRIKLMANAKTETDAVLRYHSVLFKWLSLKTVTLKKRTCKNPWYKWKLHSIRHCHTGHSNGIYDEAIKEREQPLHQMEVCKVMDL